MLKIQTEDKALKAKRFIPGERLYLDSTGNKLVKEGCPAAASLWCSEFATVSRAEYDQLIDKVSSRVDRPHVREKKPAKKKSNKPAAKKK